MDSHISGQLISAFFNCQSQRTTEAASGSGNHQQHSHQPCAIRMPWGRLPTHLFLAALPACVCWWVGVAPVHVNGSPTYTLSIALSIDTKKEKCGRKQAMLARVKRNVNILLLLLFVLLPHPQNGCMCELTAICNDNCVYFSVTITLNADEFARDQHPMVCYGMDAPNESIDDSQICRIAG